MICQWSPIRSDHRCEYSQPRKDVLRVNDDELDFADATVVEFDIPAEYRDYVQRAWREAGELHLRLLAHYWGGNALHDEVTTEHTGESVTWL